MNELVIVAILLAALSVAILSALLYTIAQDRKELSDLSRFAVLSEQRGIKTIADRETGVCYMITKSGAVVLRDPDGSILTVEYGGK